MKIDTNLVIHGAAGVSSVEPDYKEFILDAGLRRRMSRVMRMSVEAAIMTLKDAVIEKIDAIVTGTGWGCLADTEKFLISIIQNQERLLNPSAFIQSTSNTVGAQIALMRGDKHYNSTYVHGSSSFESALFDSSLLINEGKGCVLTGGFDELTPTKSHLLGRMGMWRHNKGGEGAAFFLLGSSPEGNIRGIIRSIEIFPMHYSETEIFESLISGRDLDALYMCGNEVIRGLLESEGCKTENYKEITGEYPTASAYALLIALERLSSGSCSKVILVNKYVKDPATLIEVTK